MEICAEKLNNKLDTTKEEIANCKIINTQEYKENIENIDGGIKGYGR